MLSHIVQRQRKRADRKVYALFVDLKAVFDNINRKKLCEILEAKEDRQETSCESEEYIWRDGDDGKNRRRYDQPVQDRERNKAGMYHESTTI